MENDVPLLNTKLQIPPPRPDLVPRPRLLKRLEDGLHRGRRLTLISAPAGYGKTTLLCEWLFSRKGRCAWLSLDESENDATRFLAYLLAAAEKLDGGPATEAQAGQALQIDAVLTTLINRWQATAAALEGSERWILVLDDYHLISRERVHEAVTTLLDHLPDAVHLAVSTRADPPLPIARLRARGQLTELRQADLCFDHDEATQFLCQAVRTGLDAEAIRAVTAQTEGWIAGLQMASLAANAMADQAVGGEAGGGGSQVRDEVQRFLSTLSGSDRFILDYLLEEVLQRQPEAIQSFLMQTSILRRLCGPLCEAVWSGPGELAGAGAGAVPMMGGELLAYLEQRNLFVLPLDRKREWYRYHRLFADLLRQRLRRETPHLLEALHGQASAWFEAQGLVEEAIEHAVEARDWERAAGLIEAGAESWLMRGELTTLQSWVTQLPAAQLKARPRLCIYHAWLLLLMGGPPAEVSACLSDAESAVPDGGSDTTMGARVDTVRAYAAVFQGDLASAAGLARGALARLPEEDAFLRGVAAWTHGVALIAEGDVAPGRDALDKAARASQRAGNLMVAVQALRHLAGLWMREGALHRAKAVYDRALYLVGGEPGEEKELPPVAGEVLLGLGELEREWNDLGRAQAHLEEGIRLASRGRETAALPGYVSLARLKQALGDADGALEAIQEARRLAQRSEATEMDDRVVEMLAARLAIARGDPAGAREWAEGRRLSEATGPSARGSAREFADAHLEKYERITYSRFLIDQNRPAEALQELDPLLPVMERERRGRLVVEIQVLRAQALQQEGDTGGALAALKRALSLAEPEGYVRIFLDEGQPLANLLRAIVSRRPPAGYARQLLSGIAGAQDRLLAASPLIDPPSPRELEVLRLLASARSVPEIAEELVVSVSTVRSHTKSLYSKLDAHSRHEAVARARELGLL